MFRDKIFICTGHLTRMDVVRLGNRNDFILVEDGQSTVEYLLLLAVVIAIVTAVFYSACFKERFGEGGRFARAIKDETQWNYRHGSPGRQAGNVPITYPNATHPTYYNSSRSSSHFFGPVDIYPK